MQKSTFNLRGIKPATPLETPVELATRYGVTLAASYRAAMHFAIHLPIASLPRGVASTCGDTNA